MSWLIKLFPWFLDTLIVKETIQIWWKMYFSEVSLLQLSFFYLLFNFTLRSKQFKTVFEIISITMSFCFFFPLWTIIIYNDCIQYKFCQTRYKKFTCSIRKVYNCREQRCFLCSLRGDFVLWIFFPDTTFN